MMDLFADRIGNVSITGNLVRIEFMRMKPPSENSQQISFEVSGQVVMPIDGFFRSVDMMARLRQRLVDDGVLKPVPAPERPAT